MTGRIKPLGITTVTLNPSIDEAVTIDAFTLGKANRCKLEALDPGGKGLNVSRVIHRLGRATTALGFVGGVTGDMIREKLDAEGVAHALDQVDELTRLNVMIYERSTGRRSRLYLPGAAVTPDKLLALRNRLDDVPAGAIIVLGGSVPPGLPSTIYRNFVTRLQERDVRCIVDTSGAALANVLSARPALIKPNVEEAAEVLGYDLPTDRDIVAAARELQRRGAQSVVISQGAAGAIGVCGSDAWKAVPPQVESRSTVGSGDSMVAGLAVAMNEGRPFAEGLILGTAAGAATAATPGTQLCSAADVETMLPQSAAVLFEAAA